LEKGVRRSEYLATEKEAQKRKPILLAAVMALAMGLRASEILKRQVREMMTAEFCGSIRARRATRSGTCGFLSFSVRICENW